jgi:hypothetical protein
MVLRSSDLLVANLFDTRLYWCPPVSLGSSIHGRVICRSAEAW